MIGLFLESLLKSHKLDLYSLLVLSLGTEMNSLNNMQTLGQSVQEEAATLGYSCSFPF